MVFKMPCQFLLLFGVGGMRQFKEIIKIKISLRWDLSEHCVFTSQRQGASFPPKTQSGGVLAEDGTLSHFIGWTVDRCGGAWVLHKHLCVFIAVITQWSRLCWMRHTKARCEDIYLNTLEINVRTNGYRMGVLIGFRRPGSKPASCLSDVCSSCARFLCYLEENGPCLEHIIPCSSWVSRGSREYI